MKKYKIGAYGGKFMPMHKGHLSCVELASKECEVVYLVLCIGGVQENEIRSENSAEYLSFTSRWEQVMRVASQFDNVIPAIVDVTYCRYPDGSEDWDKETQLFRNIFGEQLDAMYGSEPSYAEYFARAYPECHYRIVDVERNGVNISGTKCREMNEKERKEWMV